MRPTRTSAFVLVITAGVVACAPAPTPAPDPEREEDDVVSLSQPVAFDRSILPAPGGSLTADEIAKVVPLPDPPPVLAFHQICPDTCPTADRYGMSRTELARTMLMLKQAGYTSITPAQYLRYLRSDWLGLPHKPILITFDDGRLDAYQGADAILQATGMRATMFIITSRPDTNAGFMTWSEVALAQASGRWDIQLHAHAGHTLVSLTVDGATVSKPFYAYRLNGETYAQWKVRVESDVMTGISRLRAKVPGYQPLLFAVPYGEYGQLGSNDPAIETGFSTFLSAQFGAWFGAPPLDFTVLGSTKDKPRYTMLNTTTAASTYAWLKNQTASRAKNPAL